MPSSTLIVYEPLANFDENPEYWEDYVRYYEKYWGGPTSPFGMWFGNEYNAFKKSIADHLAVEEDEVDDCLFMKDENGDYFIAPTSNTKNIFSSENVVPLEWFLLVSEDERKNFYSHWGFNSIHYDTKLGDAKKRLHNSGVILEKSLLNEATAKSRLKPFIEGLVLAINDIDTWLSSFDSSSFVILNYGDICSHIQPYTLKNENSVFDIKYILELVSACKLEEAELKLKLFFQKWDDIKDKCMGIQDSGSIQ